MTETKTQPSFDRRSFLRTMAGGFVVLGSGLVGLSGCSSSHSTASLTLPPLPYKLDALEPYISKRTVDFHYDKHHRAYVDKTVELVKDTGLAGLSFKEIMKKTYGSKDKAAVFNNAAQAWNHEFFWNSLKPGGSKPEGEILKQIEASFGSLDNFKQEFLQVAVGRFGSGWAWLTADGKKLKVSSTSNADNPVVQGQRALLTIDVWEHAYYLDYQNRRADYVKTLIDQVLNWEFAAANLQKA
ncbi:MAG TPA: superoxide dismutase [Syntrophobacteraceae bacterium]|nr:superoxide dismutase [Syntrophobacteraceae bacterium]